MEDNAKQADEPTAPTEEGSPGAPDLSSSEAPPRFDLPADLPSPEADFVKVISIGTWTAVVSLLKDNHLPIPTLKVLVTDDLMRSADDEGERLGIGRDRRTGVERVGGGVARAKTLLNDYNSEAVVLISRETLQVHDTIKQLDAATAITHEMCHVLYGVARNATVGASPDTYIPWEIAEILACIAAEEYRCDRIATIMLKATFSANDDQGRPIELSTVLGEQYMHGLPQALDAVSPCVEQLISRYRASDITIQSMWSGVVQVSEDVLIILAHAEAYNYADELLLETADHEAVEALAAIAKPLFKYLRENPLLPGTDEWVEDRSALRNIGRAGVMTMWDYLGIRPVPMPGDFSIVVADPESDL